MFPLRDTIPSRTFPAVTLLLVAANGVAFLGELAAGDPRAWLPDLALIPGHLTALPSLPPGEWGGALLPLLSSLFLHGGWAHLLGNLWFLWVFGDNVEDSLGHLRFLLLFLAWGVAASLVHVATVPASMVPTLGASGAVSGVMGAYLLLFPRSTVVTLLPFFPFFRVVELPAVLFLGVWFLFQLLSGTMAQASGGAGMGGGVAFWAHVGGFAAGAGSALLLRRSRAVAVG